MDHKIKSFLTRSFLSIIAICIVVFVWMAVFMSYKTKDSIAEVSEIYMSETNIQLRQKFTSIVGLRLEQVEGMIRRTPPASSSYKIVMQELTTSAEVRNFSYLGFFNEQGELETVYGKKVQLANRDKFLEALENDDNVVEQGVDEDGEDVLILGRKAAYPMAGGRTSVALIVGIPMEYLNEALYLDVENAMMYSHIIATDGSFVIQNSDAYTDSYFDRIREEFDEFNGKEAEEYVQELQEAMAAGEDYATRISIGGEQRYVYCSPLSENTAWYLITVMPSGSLDKAISKLDALRVVIMIACSLIILIAMTVVFGLYYRLSQQQMQELNRLKQEAVHANMAKSEFLSSMSHDIRTPMNAIVGMTEIALKNIQDPERVEDCLQKVKLSGKHLLGLINDVLDMSKIESGKMNLNINQMSLRETMDDIVNIMQPQVKEKNLFFDILIRKIEAENVYADGVRLNQVLLNILSNAVKFTPEGGCVDIHIYQEPSPEGDEYVRTHFRIRDTGIGMSEEFQKKIFDSFSREETEQVSHITGTGLGMAITKFLVDLMGGSIELQSEPGKGSEFHVTLDFKKAETAEDDRKLPSWNMLVVDDNEQLCYSAVSNLEELGVHADWTTDGRKAVQMVEEHHRNQEDYHFVLIDWKMPGMDGMQTIYEIRKRVGKEIPIFLISAYDWSDIEQEARAAEIQGFIPKPLFKSTLYTCLSRYLGRETVKEPKQEKQALDFSGRHILLAEDIDLNWEIAEEILASVGIQTDRAVDGKVCVEMFEASKIGCYDAILMDIRMPVMNGYDATRAIRKLERTDADLPIIAMTADAFSNDVQYCLDCGMNAHLAKPIDVKELMRLLQKYLG